MKIKTDKFGIYVKAGGYRCRPVSPTRFREGDEVDTRHFSSSIRAGVGKDYTCEKGEYLEYWCTCGDDTKDIPDDLVRMGIDWYKYQFITRYPHIIKCVNLRDYITPEIQYAGDNYMTEYIKFNH